MSGDVNNDPPSMQCTSVNEYKSFIYNVHVGVRVLICGLHRYDILICCPLGQPWAANDVWQDCWIGHNNKAVPRDVQPAPHIALVRWFLLIRSPNAFAR